MKKSIKASAIIVATLMTLSSLAGCGPKTKQTSLNQGAEVKLNGDKIYPIQCEDTLTYWMDTASLWSHTYENFGDTPLGKKIAENTGIKVEYIHALAGQAAEQVQLLMASDELPDIVQHAWNNYPGGPDAAISDEYILNLNDVFEKYAPALMERLKSNENWNKQAKTDNGAYYSFPMLLEEGILQVAYGPMLRADWLRELNLETPTTISEWETVLRAFKNKGVESPFIGGLDATRQVFAPGFGIYVDWYQNDGKVVYGYAQPQYKEFLKTLNKWYNEGLIDSDIASIEGKILTSKMLNGQAGSAIAWLGSGVGQWLDANKELIPDKYDLVGAQYPALKKGENSEYSYMNSPVLLNVASAISTNCKNVELAARFLDYGYTEEGHNLFNFGIEGESYNWVDKDGEKYPQYTDFILKNPDGLTISNAMGLYMRSCYNGIMVQDERYMEQYYPYHQQTDAQKEWCKTNMGNHLLPQLYVLNEESEKDADIMASVKTYVDEMSIKFITGREPIEKFDEYLAQLEKFGLNEAIKFRQDALDRYNAR